MIYRIAAGAKHSIFRDADRRDAERGKKMYEKFRKRMKGNPVVKVLGIRMRIDRASNHDVGMFMAFDRSRIYEPAVTRLVTSLRPGMTFVDVGANNGYFSLLAAKAVGTSGKVYAFEPVPETFSRLKRNVELNRFKNVRLNRLALGMKNSTVDINLSGVEDGLNSIVSIGHAVSSTTVKVRTLDSIIEGEDIDLMKIDVEGYEKQVLMGSKRLLGAGKIKKIVFEYSHRLTHLNGGDYDACFRILKGAGFTIHEIFQNGTIRRQDISSHHELTQMGCNLYASLGSD